MVSPDGGPQDEFELAGSMETCSGKAFFSRSCPYHYTHDESRHLFPLLYQSAMATEPLTHCPSTTVLHKVYLPIVFGGNAG